MYVPQIQVPRQTASEIKNIEHASSTKLMDCDSHKAPVTRTIQTTSRSTNLFSAENIGINLEFVGQHVDFISECAFLNLNVVSELPQQKTCRMIVELGRKVSSSSQV